MSFSNLVLMKNRKGKEINSNQKYWHKKFVWLRGHSPMSKSDDESSNK